MTSDTSAAKGMDTATFESWFRLHGLDEARDSDSTPVAMYKDCLKHGHSLLTEKFTQGIDAPTLIHARSWLVDQVLRRAWSHFMGTAEDSLALVAVGGYGRLAHQQLIVASTMRQ